MSEDWLELEPPDPNMAVVEALFDEITPPAKPVVLPEGIPERQGELIRALRRLTPRQRVYIRAFMEGGSTKRGAKRVLREWGKAHLIPNDATVHRWQHDDRYLTSVSLLKRHYAELAGLDRDSVLIKVGRVLEDALEPKPVYRDNSDGGQEVVTYTEEINGNVAMRALEFAGKVNKMIGSDEGTTRVTLNIVNIANRETPDVEHKVVSEQ
jgi:hypothetical protein